MSIISPVMRIKLSTRIDDSVSQYELSVGYDDQDELSAQVSHQIIKLSNHSELPKIAKVTESILQSLMIHYDKLEELSVRQVASYIAIGLRINKIKNYKLLVSDLLLTSNCELSKNWKDDDNESSK